MNQIPMFEVSVPDRYTRADCNDPRIIYPERLGAFVQSFKTQRQTFPVIDTETTGLYPHRGARLFSVQIYCDTMQRPYILDQRFLDRDKMIQALQEIIDSTEGAVFHNAKFDLKMLLAERLEIKPDWQVHCTQVLAFCVNENRFRNGTLPRHVGATLGLDFLCKYYNVPPEFQKQSRVLDDWLATRGLGKGDMIAVPPALLVQYACQDVVATHWLWGQLKREVEASGGWAVYDKIERHLPLVLARTELRGHAVDCDFLEREEQRLVQALEKNRVTVESFTGAMDLGKDQKVHTVLTKKLGLAWPYWARTRTGKPSVDHDALKALDHPAADAIIEWRETDKLLNTYVRPWLDIHQVNGVIHCAINQNGARTGRMSSDRPNLQNVPIRTDAGKRLRQAFVPREGYANYYFDYSQIEFRLFAHYCNDASLVDGYRNDPEFDIHQQIADGLKVSRYDGKHMNFGMLYGMGIRKFAAEMGVSEEEARERLNSYHRFLPGIGKLKRRIEVAIQAKGYLVDVFEGRQRYVGRNDHAFLNYLIQGSAARAIKSRMPTVSRLAHDAGGEILNVIHDELVIEIPDNGSQLAVVKKIKAAMENFGGVGIRVPLVVDVEVGVTGWHDKREVEL